MSVSTTGYATDDEKGVFHIMKFETRSLKDTCVHIKIRYCGVCRSDFHQARNEWGNSIYPMIPGHEIIGEVVNCGSKVTNFKKGDIVGVGCLVDSCRACDWCKKDNEQYCPTKTLTYNDKCADGTIAFGGYSSDIVVEEKFVIKVPNNIELSKAAPLLCAGATIYSAMVYYGMNKPNLKIGVVGLGGLGHMAVQYGAAWGCEVTVFSSSSKKKDDSLKLGAAHFVVTSNQMEMNKLEGKLDYIIDTASNPKNIDDYIPMLQVDGTMVLVGLPAKENYHKFHASQIVPRRLSIGGSLIAGLKETQEMMDFSAKHNIAAWVKVMPVSKCNEAHDAMANNDIRYRIVLEL